MENFRGLLNGLKLSRGSSSFFIGNLLYIILTVVAFSLLFLYVDAQQHNASRWELYYAQQLALVLDAARPGDEISFDLTSASSIALKNNFKDFKNIVRFDATRHEVIVRLHSGGETRFAYFSDVVVVDSRIDLGVPGNVLHFKVVAPTGNVGSVAAGSASGASVAGAAA